MKKVVLIFSVFLIAFMFGCKKDETYIRFNNEYVEIVQGGEISFDILSNADLSTLSITSSEDIISVDEENFKIKALKEGDAVVTASIKIGDKTYSADLNVKVMPIQIESLNLNIRCIMALAEGSQQLSLSYSPRKASTTGLKIYTSDESIASIDDDLVLTCKKAGRVTVFLTYAYNDKLNTSFELEILEEDTVKPVITFEDESETLNKTIGDTYDLLDGVKAIDNVDGDITSKIEIETDFNKYREGRYEVTYMVRDNAGNEAVSMKRTYNLVYDSYVKFIGHAGCYYGLMNSEEAFINAGKRGYYAVECDLKQTLDGVFVLSHDDKFADIEINKINYNDLKNVTYTSSRGGVSYSTKICSLTRYLEICKEYNMKAVIELKYSNGINNNSQTRMSALMNEIKNCGMLNDVIFLGSQYNCLIWVKQNGYDYIPCQYLVNSLESADVLERCDTYDLDISFNISSSNSKEWISRYIENGHEVACYTFSQYSTVATLKQWLDLNLIDYFTCDILTAADATLPKEKEIRGKAKYTVNFYDYDGNLLKTSKVVEGTSAISPLLKERKGYKFVSWDKDYTNILSDTDITAVYEIINYTITLNKNNRVLEEKTFPNKNSFVDELYTDFYNYLTENFEILDGVSKNGNTYTISKNGVSVSFSSANDIKNEDIYNFEKTYSNFIYKEVTRVNDTTKVIPVIDEHFFLNSEKYREKWINMDEYFLNACIKGYPSYDRNYKVLSSGKIQIMFRFQQWQKGTNIPSFDSLPKYYAFGDELFSSNLAYETKTYNILSSFDLIVPESEKSFKEWNTKADGTGTKYERIDVGTSGDLVLYAIYND